MEWKAGIGRAVITPGTPVWLAGYGTKRVPDGKVHDLWVKTLALQSPDGQVAVLMTTDHMGIPKGMYESMCRKLQERHGLGRSHFMAAFSHNHCGPRLRDDLTDYYPEEVEQVALVGDYTDRVEEIMLETVAEALAGLFPAKLSMGRGETTFAVNRRENSEDEVQRLLASGLPPKGAVDHDVPVMAVHDESGRLRAVLFGYACHPTTLSFTQWCGDYPGFAQIDIESDHPGATAMFFNACGGDQNPIPRRNLELCERYGHMLSKAVGDVLLRPMKPVSSGLRAAFEFVPLDFEKVMTRSELQTSCGSQNAIHARWARRMLAKLDAGASFESCYPYPVQAWKLGKELLFIGIGGEAVVDYSLRFKREYGAGAWVCGYANDLIAYIPSARVWREGGYEGGPHLDEYGHPALRWAPDVEDRIAAAVARLVGQG